MGVQSLFLRLVVARYFAETGAVVINRFGLAGCEFSPVDAQGCPVDHAETPSLAGMPQQGHLPFEGDVSDARDLLRGVAGEEHVIEVAAGDMPCIRAEEFRFRGLTAFHDGIENRV